MCALFLLQIKRSIPMPTDFLHISLALSPAADRSSLNAALPMSRFGCPMSVRANIIICEQRKMKRRYDMCTERYRDMRCGFIAEESININFFRCNCPFRIRSKPGKILIYITSEHNNSPFDTSSSASYVFA